jgi:hypothetical protein
MLKWVDLNAFTLHTWSDEWVSASVRRIMSMWKRHHTLVYLATASVLAAATGSCTASGSQGVGQEPDRAGVTRATVPSESKTATRRSEKSGASGITSRSLRENDGSHSARFNASRTVGSSNESGAPKARPGGGAESLVLGSVPPASDVTDWVNYVPREPMWFIPAGAGVRNSSVYPEDNRLGLSPWWRGPNAVDNLIGRIQTGYDHGARWFFVNRPMGTLGTTYVPAGSWLTLSEQKRDELPEKLTEALVDHFDEPVHIVWFIGSDLEDARSIVGWTPSRDEYYFQVGANDTWDRTVASRVTLGGWISTGASGIAIDNSAPPHKREHFMSMFHQLVRPPFSMLVFGEALPLVYNGSRITTHDDGTLMLDMDSLRRMPWLATATYLNMRYPNHFAPGQGSLDPENTRVFVWFDYSSITYGNPDQREQLVDRWMDRGLIPITMDPVMFRRAKDRLAE